MQTGDEFGHDPGVRRTRTYFSQMETLDAALIQHSGISRFDARLRPARELRFRLFEAACSKAFQQGLRLDDSRALTLFRICQELAFQKAGFSLPSNPAGSKDPELTALAKEGMK